MYGLPRRAQSVARLRDVPPMKPPDVPLTALTRREFLQATGAAAGAIGLAAFPGCKPE